MNLVIARHGETVLNAENRVQSLQHNSPFTPKGYRQIKKLTKKLARIHIDVMYTSCLSRCIETVESALEGRDHTPVILDHRLKQKSWGSLAGMTRAKIGRRYPDSGYSTTGQNLDNEKKYIFRPPGGETWVEVTDRLKNFLSEIFHTHTHNETVVVLTHTAISRSLTSLLTGISLWDLNDETKNHVMHTFRVESQGPDIYKISWPYLSFRKLHQGRSHVFYSDKQLT